MLAMYYPKIIDACLLRSTYLAGVVFLWVKQGISDFALNHLKDIYPGLNLIVPSDEPGEHPNYGREVSEGPRIIHS